MSAQRPSPAGRALTDTTRPTLVFEHALGADGPDVVDLRALDTPVSDVALRNAVRTAWRKSSMLVVRVDGAPLPQVLALLHGLVRRELRVSADRVERFTDAHRIIARTDAPAPSAALLSLFPVRVRADAPTPHTPAAREAPCR